MKIINVRDGVINKIIKLLKQELRHILIEAQSKRWDRFEITNAVSCLLFNYAAAGTIERSAIIDVSEDNILVKIYTPKIKLVSATLPLEHK